MSSKGLLKNLYVSLLIGITAFSGCSNNEQEAPHVILDRAREHFQHERHHRALKELTKITDETQKNQEYYLLQAWSFFKLMSFKQAVEAFEKSKPNSMKLKIDIVYLHLLLGNLQKAKELTNRLERQYGENYNIYLLKGNMSLRQNQYDEAEKYLISGLAHQHYNVKLHIALGNLHLLRRNFKKSEFYYLKALSYTKEDVYAHIALAKFYIAMGRHKDAKIVLSDAMDKEPNNINISILLSNLYLRAKQYTPALDLLSRVDSQVSHSAILKTQIVRSLFYIHRYEEAYRFLQDFKDMQPLETLMLSGEYHLRSGQFDHALSEFNKESNISKNSYLTKYYLGLTQLLQGNLNLSALLLRESISDYPGFPKSYILLGMIYLYMKEFKLASEVAKLAIQLDPNDTNAHAINGIALYFEGYLKESEYEFEVIEALKPHTIMSELLTSLKFSDAPTHSNVHYIEFPDQKFQHIEQIVLRLEQLEASSLKETLLDEYISHYEYKDTDYLVYVVLGEFYKSRGDLIKSAIYLRKSIELNHACAICYYKLSEIDRLSGAIQSSILYLQKTLEVDNKFLKAYQSLGVLYEQGNNYDEARSIYEQGLTFYPRDNMLLNNLAWINLTRLNDRTAAYSQIKSAILINPDDPDSRDTLAWWHFLNGDYVQSLYILQRLTQEYPNHATYHYHIGMVYSAQHHKALGVKHFAKALSLGN